MKKLLLILALAFFGCTPEENDTSNDCNCGEILNASHITLPNGNLTTTLTVENNCSGQITTIGLSGHRYSTGQQYCNN
jgi:hypothetical protein